MQFHVLYLSFWEEKSFTFGKFVDIIFQEAGLNTRQKNSMRWLSMNRFLWGDDGKHFKSVSTDTCRCHVACHYFSMSLRDTRWLTVLYCSFPFCYFVHHGCGWDGYTFSPGCSFYLAPSILWQILLFDFIRWRGTSSVSCCWNCHSFLSLNCRANVYWSYGCWWECRCYEILLVIAAGLEDGLFVSLTP